MLHTADSIPFLAEVLDKASPAWVVALPAFLIAGIAFTLSAWRWWIGPLLFPLLLVLGWAVTSELRDPWVGPATWNESRLHFLVEAGAAVIMVVSSLAGTCTAAVCSLHARLHR